MICNSIQHRKFQGANSVSAEGARDCALCRRVRAIFIFHCAAMPRMGMYASGRTFGKERAGDLRAKINEQVSEVSKRSGVSMEQALRDKERDERRDRFFAKLSRKTTNVQEVLRIDWTDKPELKTLPVFVTRKHLAHRSCPAAQPRKRYNEETLLALGFTVGPLSGEMFHFIARFVEFAPVEATKKQVDEIFDSLVRRG